MERSVGAKHLGLSGLPVAVDELGCGDSPPKLGGVPERKRRRGGSSVPVAAGEPPRLLGFLSFVHASPIGLALRVFMLRPIS